MNKEQQLLRKKSPVQIKNKKASFEYFLVEEYTAGIVLTGTEIKSIRLGNLLHHHQWRDVGEGHERGPILLWLLFQP